MKSDHMLCNLPITDNKVHSPKFNFSKGDYQQMNAYIRAADLTLLYKSTTHLMSNKPGQF